MTRTEVVPFTHPITDEELSARCVVSGRYQSASFEGPAEYPDVDIIRVTDEYGAVRADAMKLIEEDESLRTSIEEAAVQQSVDDEEADEPDYERDFNDPRDYE